MEFWVKNSLLDSINIFWNFVDSSETNLFSPPEKHWMFQRQKQLLLKCSPWTSSQHFNYWYCYWGHVHTLYMLGTFPRHFKKQESDEGFSGFFFFSFFQHLIVILLAHVHICHWNENKHRCACNKLKWHQSATSGNSRDTISGMFVRATTARQCGHRKLQTRAICPKVHVTV